MSILENIEKSTFNSLEVQDTNKYESENEKAFDECFKSNQNYETEETSLIHSAFKKLNAYYKTQETVESDVIYWDGQVREMMETVRRIRERVPVQSSVDKMFNFKEAKEGKKHLYEGELKSSMEEIEKMDVTLQLKLNEEKKAKLSTIQSEEELRNDLAKLPTFGRSKWFKINFEEFMRLLSDVESTENGSASLQQGSEQEEKKEDKSKVEEKKEKLVQQKTGGAKFIERNIRLARCGRGVLSLTEEEKSKLDGLLVDVEDPTKCANEIQEYEDLDSLSEENYGIDCETKFILEQIDERLELLKKKKGIPQCSLTFLEKKKSEDEVSSEGEKQARRKKREKSPERLDKIDKLLNVMNSVSREEISPLTDKELASLVQQAKQNLNQCNQTEGGDGREGEEFVPLGSKPPQNVIAELVSDAKFLMPRFKYRHNNS